MIDIERRPTPALLSSPDDIDARWLASVLDHADHPAVVVRDFTLVPIGAGNVSDTVRVDMTIEGSARAPRSIVCKFRPRDQALHAHGLGSRAYEREAGAYRLLSGRRDGCRIPELIWLAGTPDNINLVMADLTRTTRAGDQLAGCGLADAEAVVVELARLHRGFHALADRDAPEWAVRMPESGDYWVPAIQRAAPIIAGHYRDRLPEAHIALVAAAGEVARTWHDVDLARATLTHGDPRVDNILFRDTDAGVEAIVIDWQVTGRRNPMHDVGYFLSGSVPVASRRASEHALLDRYASVYGEVADYRGADLLDDYRIHVVSGLMTTVAAAALLPITPAVDRLLLALLERNCAAVEDWDSIGALRAIG